MIKNILITGGAGFIGSHVVRKLVIDYPEYRIYNLDNLTYAGNLKNLKDIENCSNYKFIKGDITDENFISEIFSKYKFENIIHLAAEGCGKIGADDGGTVFDPVPFTALEPSARPTSPRRVESSVRTGGRSRICGLASTFFSRCHKQKIGPKKICQHPMYE